MSGFSWLVQRPAAAGSPTHALFAAQSHSIVDNLMALLRYSRAWNCSGKTARINHFGHSRLRVPNGHALMASVLLNVTQNRQFRPYTWNDCCRYGLPTFADPVVK